MRSAVALMLASSLVGCSLHNTRDRTIAEVVEGGVALSGVVLEGFAQSGADCDMTAAPGEPQVQCKSNASITGGIGVALILAGVVGFIATISTSSDDDDKPKAIEIKAQPEATIAAPAPAPAPVPAPAPAPPAPAPETPPATN
jgi:hypothetical protein